MSNALQCIHVSEQEHLARTRKETTITTMTSNISNHKQQFRCRGLRRQLLILCCLHPWHDTAPAWLVTLFKTQRFSPMPRPSVTRSHVRISALIGQNTGILGSDWSVQSHTGLWLVEAGCHRTWDCAALSFTSPPQAQVTNIGHLNWIMEWKGF